MVYKQRVFQLFGDLAHFSQPPLTFEFHVLERGVAVDSSATATEAPCELPTNVELELGKAADVVSADSVGART
jgi:hypothetical protein